MTPFFESQRGDCFHSHSGQSHGCFLFSLTKLLNWCRWPLLQPGLYSCESARRKENSWVATLTVLTRNFKRNELCRHVSTPQLPQPSASTLPKLTLDAGFPLPAARLSAPGGLAGARIHGGSTVLWQAGGRIHGGFPLPAAGVFGFRRSTRCAAALLLQAGATASASASAARLAFLFVSFTPMVGGWPRASR